MKILLLGDVHGNLPALEAVLRDGKKRGADMVLNTGDYVGQGAFPDETVALLRTTETVGVLGNFDRNVLRSADKKRDDKKGEKAALHRWNLRQLSKESVRYLERLPKVRRFLLVGKTFLLAHGSHEDLEEGISEETSEERLLQLADSAGAQVVCTGHTHTPFAKKVRGTWFVNPGTVGRPLGSDTRASYAIVHIQPKYFRITHFLVDYDQTKNADTGLYRGMPGVIPELFLPEQGAASRLPGEEADSLLDDIVPGHASHSRHVASLALALFDQLGELHGMGAEQRFHLQIAATLHDVGWKKGGGEHHKTAMKFILGLKHLLPDKRDRTIAATIARYHRKSDPKEGDPHFEKLSQADRANVVSLSAILRVADGLDGSHLRAVRGVECTVTENSVTVHCSAPEDPVEDRARATEKGALFERVFGRKLDIRWKRD